MTVFTKALMMLPSLPWLICWGIPKGVLSMNIGQVTQQAGGQDCGIFAAAVLTSLAHKLNGSFEFRQAGKRAHLVECMEKGMLHPLPR